MDDHNFLKDWENGAYPQGWEKKPVTSVSIEDARAYATWVGKRLPREWEVPTGALRMVVASSAQDGGACVFILKFIRLLPDISDMVHGSQRTGSFRELIDIRRGRKIIFRLPTRLQ